MYFNRNLLWDLYSLP